MREGREGFGGKGTLKRKKKRKNLAFQARVPLEEACH